MEALPLVRRLWRRRLMLACGALAAIAIVVAVGLRPAAKTGVAWTRVALDTPKSQLVDSSPSGADTMPWRASLLVHLMATDSTQQELARQLGVQPGEVTVVDPALATPTLPASLPKQASDAAAVTVAPYKLTVELKNSVLPVISIMAEAPDRAAATRLAKAAAAVLKGQASAGGRYESFIPAKGAKGRILQAFVVEDAAALRSKTVAASDAASPAIGAVVMLLFVWCALLALVPSRPSRRPRAAALA